MKGFCSLMYLGLLGLSLGTGVAMGTDSGQASQGKDDDKVKSDTSGEPLVHRMHVGYPFKLTCNFTDVDDANSAIQLDWYKDEVKLEENDRFKIFQENFTLVNSKPVREDTGNYECRTRTGDDPLSKIIQVIFFDLRRMDKSQNVVENEEITFECPVDGSPHPIVTWMKDQKVLTDIIANTTRFVLKTNSNGIANGSFTIIKADWADRGNYSCLVKTLVQTNERWTFLRVKDVYAALWPFIGIVIEVVILGIIIVIFEKRRAKAEFDESDTDQGNDQKNTADRNKDRRRK